MTVNQVSVRLSDELHNQLTTLAQKMGVAKSKILVYALTDYLQNQDSLNSLEANTVQNRLNQLEKRVLDLEKRGTESPQPYRQQTTPVQSFFPNAFGLYDMHGNVWEWCLDHWHPNYLDAPDSAIAWLADDPLTRRILRGGSWDFDPQYCRSTSRYAYSPTGLPLNQIGFRVVCDG